MGGPASSTRVFRPFSASSFAAHPPEMPEPTTIASYARDGGSDRDTAIVSSGNDGSLDQVLGHGFGGEVGEYREVLQHPEGALGRSEEHTSELQSLTNLVCRLLLEKKKKK